MAQKEISGASGLSGSGGGSSEVDTPYYRQYDDDDAHNDAQDQAHSSCYRRSLKAPWGCLVEKSLSAQLNSPNDAKTNQSDFNHNRHDESKPGGSRTIYLAINARVCIAVDVALHFREVASVSSLNVRPRSVSRVVVAVELTAVDAEIITKLLYFRDVREGDVRIYGGIVKACRALHQSLRPSEDLLATVILTAYTCSEQE